MMTETKVRAKLHPSENDMADFLAGTLPERARKRLECHIADCDECLAAVVSAYESVGPHKKMVSLKGKVLKMIKKINIYLVLAALSFFLSFVLPKHFIQLLVATLLFGIKWVVDSKTTKMLVMIHEAWKSGGEKEASRVLERIDKRDKVRF